MKKVVLTPFTILCLLSTVFLIGLLFHIQPVKASETIYLKADGSVDPPTAPISSVDNITYTLTDNINDSIVVWRDNIVVDGVGHVLQGTGGGTGIGLSGTENVTVKNIGITGWYYGIGYHGCVNASISANTIVNNCHGIWFNQSSNNKISGNALAYNNVGICLMVVVHKTIRFFTTTSSTTRIKRLCITSL